ncbi:hypothetical protein ACLOJK_006468 [Asimina triloba]
MHALMVFVVANSTSHCCRSLFSPPLMSVKSVRAVDYQTVTGVCGCRRRLPMIDEDDEDDATGFNGRRRMDGRIDAVEKEVVDAPVVIDPGLAHHRRRAGWPVSSDQVPTGGGFAGDERGAAVVVGRVRTTSTLAGTCWIWIGSSSPLI